MTACVSLSFIYLPDIYFSTLPEMQYATSLACALEFSRNKSHTWSKGKTRQLSSIESDRELRSDVETSCVKSLTTVR
jgi:hypothetical protein